MFLANFNLAIMCVPHATPFALTCIIASSRVWRN